MNKKIDLELKRLTSEKEELTRKLEILASNIAILHKVCDSGLGEENLPSLGSAVNEAMKGLKRFTRTELAERVKHLYPDLEFNEASVVKPVKNAMLRGQVKLAQPSQGNKRQAVYEWIAEA